MISQLNLLVREYIAQKLLLLAVWIAPKEFAYQIGKCILNMDPSYIWRTKKGDE